MTNSSGDTSNVSKLSAVCEKKTGDRPKGLLKIFWDPIRLSQEGPSQKAIQARLIQGQEVRWLSVFMQPGFKGSKYYGDFPLAQLLCNGVFNTPTIGRLELSRLPLSEIPEGGCQIAQTNNMAKESDPQPNYSHRPLRNNQPYLESDIERGVDQGLVNSCEIYRMITQIRNPQSSANSSPYN